MQSASLQVTAAKETAEEAAVTDNGPAAALEVSSAPRRTFCQGFGGAVPIPPCAEEQHGTRSELNSSWSCSENKAVGKRSERSLISCLMCRSQKPVRAPVSRLLRWTTLRARLLRQPSLRRRGRRP